MAPRKLDLRTRQRLMKSRMGKAPKRQPPKVKKPVGRPPMYSKDKAARICIEIATTTRSLKDICDSNPTFPDPRTVYKWLSLNEEFRQMYQSAKQDQAQILADELIAIADTPKHGQVITAWPGQKDRAGNPKPKEIKVADMIEHRRLQIETRRWLLSKLRPREYGDKIEVTEGSDPLQELLDAWREEHAQQVKKEQSSIKPAT